MIYEILLYLESKPIGNDCHLKVHTFKFLSINMIIIGDFVSGFEEAREKLPLSLIVAYHIRYLETAAKPEFAVSV